MAVGLASRCRSALSFYSISAQELGEKLQVIGREVWSLNVAQGQVERTHALSFFLLEVSICCPLDVSAHQLLLQYGVTTGRKRRCGWLDMVQLRYSQAVNGFDRYVVAGARVYIYMYVCV